MHVCVVNSIQTGANGVVGIGTLCLHSWHTKEIHNPKRIGSTVPDNYYYSRSSSGRQSEMQDDLMMLFHCNITEPFDGQYVYDALGTTAPLWPSWLYWSALRVDVLSVFHGSTSKLPYFRRRCDERTIS